jgi:penicillin-insensitive murein DD-endopeptidase
MTMASLPKECRAVLKAPDPVSEAAVTIGGNGTATVAAAPAPEEAPATDPSLPVSAFTDEPDVPLPLPRPEN